MQTLEVPGGQLWPPHYVRPPTLVATIVAHTWALVNFLQHLPKQSKASPGAAQHLGVYLCPFQIYLCLSVRSGITTSNACMSIQFRRDGKPELQKFPPASTSYVSSADCRTSFPQGALSLREATVHHIPPNLVPKVWGPKISKSQMSQAPVHDLKILESLLSGIHETWTITFAHPDIAFATQFPLPEVLKAAGL